MVEKAPPAPRKRLSPDARRKSIVTGAIAFFAEHGLDGSTHQLAKYLNVTQPLIYQYFPSKEELIDAVYEDLFQGRWDDRWDAVLSDRSRPLRARLLDFYGQYFKVMHAPEWIRIYLYSGLRNLELNRRYNPIIEERVIRRICIEIRDSLGLPGLDRCPLTEDEFEAVWTLHGGLFYYGVRRYIYKLATSRDTEAVIRGAVTCFLAGMSALAEEIGLTEHSATKA
jgi:AcrR family transcriptional regulator